MFYTYIAPTWTIDFLIEYIIISESSTLQKHDFWTFLIFLQVVTMGNDGHFESEQCISKHDIYMYVLVFYTNKNDHICNVPKAIFKKIFKEVQKKYI